MFHLYSIFQEYIKFFIVIAYDVEIRKDVGIGIMMRRMKHQHCIREAIEHDEDVVQDQTLKLHTNGEVEWTVQFVFLVCISANLTYYK